MQAADAHTLQAHCTSDDSISKHNPNIIHRKPFGSFYHLYV